MAEVACLGILVADLLGRPIDVLPERGRLGIVDSMELHIGGCAANTGVDLQRLGIETAVLGMVGQDGLGAFVRSKLTDEDVNCQGVSISSTTNTSSTMVMVDSSGERTFLHYFGANAVYSESDVNWNVINTASILHVAGALVMPTLDGEPMARVMAKAQSLGKLTCLDTVWDATGKWMETLLPVLTYTDIFMPSLSEAQKLTGQTDEGAIANELMRCGVKTVVLKLGDRGCYFKAPGMEIRVPAFSVNAIDGTGSGDAFDAGLLCGLAKGWDMATSARFANAVGALCVTGIGATAGVRSFSETEAFIRAQSA